MVEIFLNGRIVQARRAFKASLFWCPDTCPEKWVLRKFERNYFKAIEYFKYLTLNSSGEKSTNLLEGIKNYLRCGAAEGPQDYHGLKKVDERRVLFKTIVERRNTMLRHLNWFTFLTEGMIEECSGRGKPREDYIWINKRSKRLRDYHQKQICKDSGLQICRLKTKVMAFRGTNPVREKIVIDGTCLLYTSRCV